MSPMTDHLELRQRISDAALALAENSATSFSGHCNLSNRVSDDTFLLTNIEGHARTATPQDIALVDSSGNILDGDMEPGNIEIIQMHAAVYRKYPEYGGVVHTHSPYLLAFAMANTPLECRYEGMLRWGQATNVPVVPWAPRGSEHSVEGIMRTLEAHPHTKAVLLGNHGVLVFGGDVTEAAQLLIILEEAAQGELNSLPIGGAKDFPPGALEEVRESMRRAREHHDHGHSHDHDHDHSHGHSHGDDA
ncbi:MAG: class II aldolase/adducin family protein [Leucobacter sp.]